MIVLINPFSIRAFFFECVVADGGADLNDIWFRLVNKTFFSPTATSSQVFGGGEDR